MITTTAHFIYEEKEEIYTCYAELIWYKYNNEALKNQCAVDVDRITIQKGNNIISDPRLKHRVKRFFKENLLDKEIQKGMQNE